MAKKIRPDTLSGITRKVTTPCGNFYVTLNKDNEGNLLEVKTQMGKSGSCVRGLFEVNSILISVILQSGVEKEQLEKIFKRYLSGVNCGNDFVVKGEKYHSCMDYMARAILAEIVGE